MRIPELPICALCGERRYLYKEGMCGPCWDNLVASGRVRHRRGLPDKRHAPRRKGVNPRVVTERRITSVPPEGMLLCDCWCQEYSLFIPKEDVWRGWTESCGLEGCKPPSGYSGRSS